MHSYDIPARTSPSPSRADIRATSTSDRNRYQGSSAFPLSILRQVSPFFYHCKLPLTIRLCWYVAERYCNELRQIRAYRPRAATVTSAPHPVVLEGLIHLAQFLITQADIIENPDEEDKKRSFVNGKIPQEIVKDPSGLARELLWRVRRELGQETYINVDSVSTNGSLHAGQSNGVDQKPKVDNEIKGRNTKRMRVVPPKSRTSAFSPL